MEKIFLGSVIGLSLSTIEISASPPPSSCIENTSSGSYIHESCNWMVTLLLISLLVFVVCLTFVTLCVMCIHLYRCSVEKNGTNQITDDFEDHLMNNLHRSLGKKIVLDFRIFVGHMKY